jgi:hypothetical protein
MCSCGMIRESVLYSSSSSNYSVIILEVGVLIHNLNIEIIRGIFPYDGIYK